MELHQEHIPKDQFDRERGAIMKCISELYRTHYDCRILTLQSLTREEGRLYIQGCHVTSTYSTLQPAGQSSLRTGSSMSGSFKAHQSDGHTRPVLESWHMIRECKRPIT